MLKLMTFNIRNGDADDGPNSWLQRHDIVAKVIEQQAPDILGLQEVFDYQLDYLLDRLPQYASVGVGRDDGCREGEFSPILYQRELMVEREGTFWLSETPEEPGSGSWNTACVRICTWAELDTAEGPVTVFNCHLDHASAEARREGLRLIGRRISESSPGRPAILMGDFNAGEAELNEYEVLHTWMLDTFREVHPDEAQICTYHDFLTGPLDGDKIDYIFAGIVPLTMLSTEASIRPPAKLQILDSQIVRTCFDGRAPSDHFPVVAKLAVTR